MKRFRTALFWLHLLCGVTAGVVILVMSFTGVVLAFKPQIQDWIERDVRYVTPQDSPRLGAHQLLAAVKDAKPEPRPSRSRWRATRQRPPPSIWAATATCTSIRTRAPFSATGSARTTQFFQSMTTWHRYLGATGEYRATGRSATGISNLAFLVLARHRPVHLVAEAVHAPVPEADRVVPAHARRACARFQLAQHDWVLVC